MKNNEETSNNSYFKKALSQMVASAAYVDAVRHMHDSGMSASEIKKNIDFPITIETINSVIDEYEKKKATGDCDYEYIQQLDEYGRRSFIRVKKG